MAVIEVKNLSKIYDFGEVKVKALDGVSLDINQGDFIIITGRNGSGKSTLLHQLGLLDKPTAGEIYLQGQEVASLSEKKRSTLRLRYLGYIFQEYALISDLTALENVMLPAMMIRKLETCKKKAQELLIKVGLEQQFHHLPKQLSGGEQQKVAIARALINDPMVVFADEPTANLDSLSAKDVLAVFKRLNQHDRHTIVMVTHEQEETIYGNQIIKLADGKIET